MSPQKILIYLLRRDLRIHDNPILHELSRIASSQSKPTAPFTHLLPLYIFPAQQIEVSGFLSPSNAETKSPCPEARSQIGKFWRCGQHRAKFIAECVWDVKISLESVGSGLEMRVGMMGDVVRDMIARLKEEGSEVEVGAVWMTAEEGVEERREERVVRRVVEGAGKEFRLWKDEKYFVDDDDVPFQDPQECPDIFTSYKKMVEPLRSAPRPTLPAPTSLPPLPSNIPPQPSPFSIPTSLPSLISALHKPLSSNLDLPNPPKMPSSGAASAFPFSGGNTSGHERLTHLIQSGAMMRYKDTRNGLLGTDFSSKLSAWLALGAITAREVHAALVDFEDGVAKGCEGTEGYGKGENVGTKHMRFELLWRDYMRLCARKFGSALFRAEGFRCQRTAKWNYDQEKLERWLRGTTGTGLIDASMREVYLTGYTSNRARQNVASFLSAPAPGRMGMDWRLGAEWYECVLVDYDVCSNWGNWQYVAGVGNDPRQQPQSREKGKGGDGGGGGKTFNPIKQAFDYDPEGRYVKSWVEEVRGEELSVDEVFRCWKVREGVKEKEGLGGNEMVERPVLRVEWGRGRGGRGRGGRRGRGRGGM